MDAKTQFAALCALYGKGRVMGTFNKFCTLKALQTPDPLALLDEALDLEAEAA